MICAVLAARFEADRDPASSGRELDGVVEQVGDHLLQASRITVDGAEGAMDGELERYPLRFCRGLRHVDRTLQRRP